MMNVIKAMLGEECEVCGNDNNLIEAYIPLWNYGHREYKKRTVCGKCHKLHLKGQL